MDGLQKDGITDYILEISSKKYGKVLKEDIFFYIYGILHSPDYRKMFENNLKKSLPHIHLLDAKDDFWAFSEAGRQLADLHLNYEDVPSCEEVTIKGDRSNCHVEKMKFLSKDRKDTIILNDRLMVENIPERAYEYMVNGSTAIEWIMDRYRVKVGKKSGILNDPNKYGKEIGKPTYILDLLLSVINVSIKTLDIVEKLPKLKFE